MRSPESLTPNRRFSADSQRSPAMVATPTERPISAAAIRLSRKAGSAAIRVPTAMEARSPPTKPDQVLFGENRGQSLGPLNVLPTANAPMSAAQVQANSIIIHQCPWVERTLFE